jgi:hypothetical protein
MLVRKVIGILLLAAAGLFGCKTQPDLSELVNDMVVMTSYDTLTNFSNFPTYTLPLDTIGLISNSSSETYLADSYAKMINSAVRRNFTETNRVRVEKNQDPDLGVNIYVVNDLSIYQSVVYPGYGYPGYGYGGYYGYYNYPYINTQVSQQAILVIEVVSLKQVDPATNEPKKIWVANIGDLISSFEPEKKVTEAIDQAFVQSQYLTR